jgi:hypothetical protein
VKVIPLRDDQEFIRRLTTGVIVAWPKLSSDAKSLILREATLAMDPESKTQTSLEQDLKQFIERNQGA